MAESKFIMEWKRNIALNRNTEYLNAKFIPPAYLNADDILLRKVASVKVTKNGTVASIAGHEGRTRTFDDFEEAKKWCQNGVAALFFEALEDGKDDSD